MKYLLLLILLKSFLGCHKSKKVTNSTASGPEYTWSRYIGTYDVYDTVNHTQWVMKITHLYHSDYNKGNEDSVLIENFANKFTIRDTWFPVINGNILDPAFMIKIYNPIKDKYGFNWALNSRPDTSVNYLVNTIKNDTIIINFQISNIAYYFSENVPYYACINCKHIVVKRH